MVPQARPDHSRTPPHAQIHAYRPQLPTFSGSDDKVLAETWLKQFEAFSTNYNWDVIDKVSKISNHLAGDALNWYHQHSDLEWGPLKLSFLERFGAATADPLRECVDLKYDHKVGMRGYFEGKRRLGALAELSEKQIVSLLIHGLPSRFTHYFPTNPSSASQFYATAKNCRGQL